MHRLLSQFRGEMDDGMNQSGRSGGHFAQQLLWLKCKFKYVVQQDNKLQPTKDLHHLLNIERLQETFTETSGHCYSNRSMEFLQEEGYWVQLLVESE